MNQETEQSSQINGANQDQRISFSNNNLFSNAPLRQETLVNQIATANFSSLGQSSASHQMQFQDNTILQQVSSIQLMYSQEQEGQAQLDSSKEQIDMNDSFQSQELYEMTHPVHLQSRHLENQQPQITQKQQAPNSSTQDKEGGASKSLNPKTPYKQSLQSQPSQVSQKKSSRDKNAPRENTQLELVARSKAQMTQQHQNSLTKADESRRLEQSQVEEPQILETAVALSALKPQSFDFQNLKRQNKRRDNKSFNMSSGNFQQSFHDSKKDELNKFQHKRNSSSFNHNSKGKAASRSQSQSSKRTVIQLSNLPEITNGAQVGKFEDYVKNSQIQEDILSKSIKNEAQTSARLQSQEFNQNLKLAHVFAVNSLNDLSEKNQPSYVARQKTHRVSHNLEMPQMNSLKINFGDSLQVIKQGSMTSSKAAEQFKESHFPQGIPEEPQEETDSPLRAMQIARRQSILKQKLQNSNQQNSRRESFFGSQHTITPDPLKKLLQTKRYLNNDGLVQQQLSSGLMTERIQTRKQSVQQDGLVKSTATLKALALEQSDGQERQNESVQGSISFKNELLKRTLNTNSQGSQVHSGQLSVRTKTPDITHLKTDRQAAEGSSKPQYFKYRDQAMLNNTLGVTSDPRIQQAASRPQSFLANEAGQSKLRNCGYGSFANALALPNLMRSPESMINDTVQQALIAEHINDYNRETHKYNSVLIHLGVLLKKAASAAEHNSSALNLNSKVKSQLGFTQSLPSRFITIISCQILDKISLFFPQFSKILVPLKNSLFQSVFCNFNSAKHFQEDERELERTKNDIDLTKKDPKITPKYHNYETYHDKVMQLAKENKHLKREVLRMSKDYQSEQKQQKIIKNLVEKFRKLRTRESMKRVLTSLRFHSNSKYQGLFSQVISHAILGQDIKNKTIQRRYFNELKLYAKDSKLRKTKKEIEYYQNKNDDLDDNNSNQKLQIRDLLLENQKYKAMLLEKNKQLAIHESEMSQFQMDSSKKKPSQIKECLKVYFKYMYTNPLISRLRLKNISQPNGLFALSHQSISPSDASRPPTTYKPLAIGDSLGSSRPDTQQRGRKQLGEDQVIGVDMSLLLRRRETVQEGGMGLSVLLSLSLRDIMLRWANFMIEKATTKLEPIIQILKAEIHRKRQIRLNSRRQGIRSRGKKSNQEGSRLEFPSPNRSSSSDGESSSGDERADKKQEGGEEELDFELQLGFHNNKNDFFKDYQPFSNYKQDLRLLLTFKAMISKVIQDFQLNMINSGVIQAILFVIDQTERQIEITVSHPQLFAPPQSQPQLPFANQGNSMRNLGGLQRGQSQYSNLPEQETTEEVTVPDYKYLLSYINNTNVETRARLLIEQVEKVHHQKFDWYFSLSELLTGKEQNYTTVLLYLFYNFPCLENSAYTSNLYLSHKKMKSQSSISLPRSISPDRNLRHPSQANMQSTVMEQQQVLEQEIKLNLQVYKKVLYNSRQKILPLLTRKVNSHLHDVSLLYSQEELDRHNANPLEQLLDLPFLEPKQLMVRWVNHLLRSYHEIRIQYELEAKFKNKFAKDATQTQGFGPGRSQSNNLTEQSQQQDQSPVFKPIKANPLIQVNPQSQPEKNSKGALKSHNHPDKSKMSPSPNRQSKSQSRNQQLESGRKSTAMITPNRMNQTGNSNKKKRAASNNQGRDSEPNRRAQARQNKFRIVQDGQTKQLMKQYNLLNPDLEDLGFEISKSSQLSQENFHRLILLLAYLCPETLWDMYDMDYVEVRRHQHYVELVEDFVSLANFDEKVLFLMNAVIRITKKNNLISMNDLYLKGRLKYTDLLIELFLARPCLNNSRHNSHFMGCLQTIEDFYNSQKKYLQQFGKKSYDEIDEHVKSMRDQREELQEAFTFIQDCDRIFSQLKEKLLINKLSFPNPHTIIARQMNIYERSELLLSEIEKSILHLNRSFLFQLLTFRQAQQGTQWAGQIELVIRKYLYPIRRYLNIYIDQDGFVSYFDMWRAIKSLNVRSFIIDAREVEGILIKILKLKDTRLASKKSILGPKYSNNNLQEDSLNAGMSALEEGLGLASNSGGGFDQVADLFMKKIKSEIQYTVFSNKRGGSTQRFRTKSSLVKEIEESLENVYLKTQLYRAKFTASDLILVLIAILFRQNPSDFVRELTKICPMLYDEGVKNVNKMLSKEKIGVHVEAYLTEYSPSLLFEQFLIHNVLIKTEFAKKHPFRINMMKHDFRSFLDHYLNSLFAVFDFYLHEYQLSAPQPVQFMQFCIQVEAVYGLLRDFNAFSQESGLTKSSLKKILLNVQRQIGSLEQFKLQSFKQGGVSGLDQYSALINQTSTPTKATKQSSSNLQNTMNNSGNNFYQGNTQANNRGSSPYSNSTRNNLPGLKATLSTSADNQLTQQLTQEGGLESLTFFEFMECLYLVSQYYNPDPFTNANQKFADFLERQVFVNIQFKIKSKKLQDSPHKKNLIKSLQNHKVIRGANLDTFNAYFELQ